MANTLSCPFPSVLDALTVNGFNLHIAKLPELTFFCQEANIPSVIHPQITVHTPLQELQQPSSVLRYTPLEVTFMVDAQMNNYVAIYEWMKGLGFPETHQQFTDFLNRADNNFIDKDSKVFSTGFLQILGANNLPVRTIEYVDLFPLQLGTAVFSTTQSDAKYLVGRATFGYTLYKIT